MARHPGRLRCWRPDQSNPALKTPKTCACAPAGLVSGPRRLKIVRLPICLRAGAAWRGRHEQRERTKSRFQFREWPYRSALPANRCLHRELPAHRQSHSGNLQTVAMFGYASTCGGSDNGGGRGNVEGATVIASGSTRINHIFWLRFRRRKYRRGMTGASLSRSRIVRRNWLGAS